MFGERKAKTQRRETRHWSLVEKNKANQIGTAKDSLLTGKESYASRSRNLG
jgi:hypothetical protein